MINDKNLVLEKLKKIWNAYPDLRLGQLLCNIGDYGTLYYINDTQLIETLEKKYNVDTSDVTLVEPVKNDTEESSQTYKRKMPENKGRKYIHNKEGKMKSIMPEELDHYLKNGWKLGRKEL